MAKKATLEAAEVTEGFTTRFVTAKFVSMDGSELFFGKPVVSAKTSAETFDQFDERTWQERFTATRKAKSTGLTLQSRTLLKKLASSCQ